MFKRPFSFKGRIRRTEFCLSYLISWFLYIVFALIVFLVEELFRSIEGGVGLNVLTGMIIVLVVLSVLAFLVLWCWFVIAQNAKRSHDMGLSGWYQLIPFFVVGLLFCAGDVGTNKYGDDPKGVKAS